MSSCLCQIPGTALNAGDKVMNTLDVQVRAHASQDHLSSGKELSFAFEGTGDPL